MRNRTKTFEPIVALFVGASIAIGVQKVTEQHIGWLVLGLISIPGVGGTIVLTVLRWKEATRDDKAEKDAAARTETERKIDINFPGIFP